MSEFSALLQATAGLVSHWKFQEASGTVADDAVGSNNGVYTNLPSLGQIGMPAGGNAIGVSFPANSHVVVADHATLKPNEFTFGGWIKASQTGRFHYIGRKYSTGGYAVRISDGTPGIFQGFANIGGLKQIDGVAALTDNIWHMLVLAYDNVTLRANIDGVDIGDIVVSGAPTYDSSGLFLGQFTGEVGTHTLDDVFLFNRALTAPELLALYTAGFTAYEPQIEARATHISRIDRRATYITRIDKRAIA